MCCSYMLHRGPSCVIALPPTARSWRGGHHSGVEGAGVVRAPEGELHRHQQRRVHEQQRRRHCHPCREIPNPNSLSNPPPCPSKRSWAGLLGWAGPGRIPQRKRLRRQEAADTLPATARCTAGRASASGAMLLPHAPSPPHLPFDLPKHRCRVPCQNSAAVWSSASRVSACRPAACRRSAASLRRRPPRRRPMHDPRPSAEKRRS